MNNYKLMTLAGIEPATFLKVLKYTLEKKKLRVRILVYALQC